MIKSTLVALACISAVWGAVDLRNPLLQRDINALLPRETKIAGGISSKCESVLSKVIGSLPTPPPKLATAESSLARTNSDPCSFTPPSSLSKVYSAYTSELFSWYSKHSREVDAAFKVCTELKTSAANFLKVCSTDSNVPTALRASATSTSGAGGSKQSGTSTTGSSSSSTGAAAHETGMALGALAAGLFAAVF